MIFLFLLIFRPGIASVSSIHLFEILFDTCFYKQKLCTLIYIIQIIISYYTAINIVPFIANLLQYVKFIYRGPNEETEVHIV